MTVILAGIISGFHQQPVINMTGVLKSPYHLKHCDIRLVKLSGDSISEEVILKIINIQYGQSYQLLKRLLTWDLRVHLFGTLRLLLWERISLSFLMQKVR